MRTYFEGTPPRPLQTDFTGRNDKAAILRSYAEYVEGTPPMTDHAQSSPLGWREGQSNDTLYHLDSSGHGRFTLLNPAPGLGADEVVVYLDRDDHQVKVGYCRSGSRAQGTEIRVSDRPGTSAYTTTNAWVKGGAEARRLRESTRLSVVLSAPFTPSVESAKGWTDDDFQVGATVWTTDVPSRRDLNGREVVITQVDRRESRFWFMEGTMRRYCHFSGARVVKRPDGTYIPGTPVRVVRALPNATARFHDAICGLVTEVAEPMTHDGPDMIRVKASAAIINAFPDSFSSGRTTPVAQVEVVAENDGSVDKAAAEAALVKGSDGLTAEQWKKKWDDLWAALGREANDRDWCGEYDAFARTHGGPERPEEYDVRVMANVVLDVDEADRLLGPLIGPSARADVQEDVTIVNRFWLRDISGFSRAVLEDPDEHTFERLAEIAHDKGYKVSEITEIVEVEVA